MTMGVVARPKCTDIGSRQCPNNGYYLVTRSRHLVLCLSILYEQISWPTCDTQLLMLLRTKRSSMATMGPDTFTGFEIRRPWIETTLRALTLWNLWNTVFDALFYDVGGMATDLFLHGSIVVQAAAVSPSARFSEMTEGFSQLDLSALSNPAGSILGVDAGRPPHILQFADVPNFIRWANAHGQALRTVSVTGVGSSALGSAAFAWNVSTALDEPVAAIVPGYGVADAIQQGLEGCFGVYIWWIKRMGEEILAHTIPLAAPSHRHLTMTAPGDAEANVDAPMFRRSSGSFLPAGCNQSSNVLRAILKDVPSINRVFGHSKGVLAIKNALHGLPRETTQRLHIVTFGCSIAEDTPTAGYSQFLGLFDGLGLLSSWGNASHTLIPAHHSTSTSIPLSMPVSVLTRLAMMRQAPQPPTITNRLIGELGATTNRRRNGVAPQRREEGTGALMARIHVDEGTYADN
jgi:hypothetical protein